MGDNRAHSELGASIAARWIACAGSVALSRGQPQSDNVHAQAGRAAHDIAETCLRYGANPQDFVGDMVAVSDDVTVEVTEEMAEAVQQYVDYCRMIMAEPGVQYWIERQFTLAALNPPADMFGTSDFPAYKPALKELEVVDYKHGQGLVVEVKNNPQLYYYALGVALELGNEYPIERVKITIVQPRVGHPDGPVRSETITYLELLEFAGELLTAAEKTQQPDAPLNPGSHCRFCPALAICPAQRKQAQELAQVAFAEMPVSLPPAPEVLSDELLGDLLSKSPLLTDWVAAMHKEAEHRLRAGRSVPGVKLVEKRPKRVWRDKAEVEMWLKEEKQLFDEEIYKVPELKSPAQIEKLVGKKELPAEFVEKKSSGYKLVDASHPSPALALSAGDAFLALPPGDAE